MQRRGRAELGRRGGRWKRGGGSPELFENGKAILGRGCLANAVTPLPVWTQKKPLLGLPLRLGRGGLFLGVLQHR